MLTVGQVEYQRQIFASKWSRIRDRTSAETKAGARHRVLTERTKQGRVNRQQKPIVRHACCRNRERFRVFNQYRQSLMTRRKRGLESEFQALFKSIETRGQIRIRKDTIISRINQYISGKIRNRDKEFIVFIE